MHILLVEDDDSCRAVVEATLADDGVQITRVRSGLEAVALLDRGLRPDLLVTEIQLPGDCDGWLVAHIFQLACPSLPVIYITASQPSTDQVTNSVFLRKPFGSDLLRNAIRSMVAPRTTGRLH